jgi:hypothetical protein
MRDTPFDYLQHLVTVPVRLNGQERRFVLDSGIGLDLVRDTVEGVVANGRSFAGRRMSGQEVTSPLGIVSSLEFAGIVQRDVEVGLIDLSGFPPQLGDIDGFLSLAFFAEQPFTVDYPQRTIRDGRATDGFVIPVVVERDGPSVDVFMSLTIPGGRSILVEVDMGSDCLILDERFAAEVGVDLDCHGVRRVEGVDETGNAYLRSFTRLDGNIHPTSAPALTMRDPDVVFQRIIHDGLVGDAFLRNFVVTWDIAAAQIVLTPHRAGEDK